VGVAYAQTTVPNPQAAVFNMASQVYFSDGKTLVSTFGSTDRQILQYNAIPPLPRDAVLAAEDKTFWNEGGISPTGILRAAYYDLTSSGGSLQGGSTITQQLVRNFYDDIGTQQTMSRKIKEIFVAEKLAQEKSKPWILQNYLNTVYFGNGAYGIAAAAETYFSKPVASLSVPEAAMIAAMIQSPSYYSTGVVGPHPDPGALSALKYRWGYVLNNMKTMGTITAQQYAQAQQQGFPIVHLQNNPGWSGYRGYIMRAVYNELQSKYHFKDSQINNGGFRIVTTFSKAKMDALYKSVRDNKALMKAGTPPTGATAPSTGLPSYVNIGAVLEDPSSGAITAMYSGDDYNKSQYDMALVARNQVGSSFKPYVLAAAVKQGMNIMTSKLNGYSPLWIPPDSQPFSFASLQKPADSASWYQVANDEVSNPNRPVSVTEATALSLNTAYTDLWHRVAYNAQTNTHPVTDIAREFGVNVGAYPDGSGMTQMQDEAGITLGQASLTVEEQATMIATLADNGLYHSPHVIKAIGTPDPVTGGTTWKQADITRNQVLTPQEAADVNYAMSFDTTGQGTAAGMGLTNGQPVIAKTGTTNLSQQAFFMGATPMDAMAVGMFVTDNACPKAYETECSSISSLKYNPNIPGLETLFGVGGWAGYGGQWPAEIWHTFFMNEFNTLPVQNFGPVNVTGMTTWNLVGSNMPQPKPKNKQPNPGPTCWGMGRHRCQPSPTPGGPTPPTPTPTGHQCGVLPCPGGTPTVKPTAVRAAAVPIGILTPPVPLPVAEVPGRFQLRVT
jgi:membrane peptidoglycan carboxypeptidase